MKRLIHSVQEGKASVKEVPTFVPQRGIVLVKTVAALVSAGKERMVVEFASKSLLQKACARVR